MNRGLPLSDGGTLVPGAGGQRWIVRGSALEHAKTVFPEDVTAVLRGPGASFVFVGASGGLYRSKTPLGEALRESVLGDPLRESALPEYFELSTASNEAIVGIQDGRLFRSVDRGASWDELASMGLQGRARDVVLARDGRGLLLMLPQQLFATRDHGSTWTPISLPVSPSTLDLADDGAPYVGTPSAARRLLPGSNALAAPIAVSNTERWIWEDPGAPVEAIAMDGEMVVAVARDGTSALRASVSRLADRRSYRAIDGLANCEQAVAAAARDHVVVGCVAGGASPTLRVARSFDTGKTWRVSAAYALHAATTAQRGLAAGAKGALLFAGSAGPTLLAEESAAPKVLVANGEVLTAGRFDDSSAGVVFTTSNEHATELFTTSLDGAQVTTRGTIKGNCLRVALDIDGAHVIRAGCARREKAPSTDEHLVSLRASPGSNLEVVRGWSAERPEFALANGRGLASESGYLFEGITGVDWFVAIGAAPKGPVACSAAGCAFASASRVGWNPPALRPNVFGGLVPIRVGPWWDHGSLKLKCTEGKLTNTLVTRAFAGLDITTSSGDAYRLATPTGLVRATWKTPTAQSLSFFPNAPASQTIHHPLPNGFVSLRYRVVKKTPGTLPLIAADVAWERTGKTKMNTAALRTIGRFAIDEGWSNQAIEHWPYVAGLVGDDVIVRPTHPFLRDDAEQGSQLGHMDFDIGAGRPEWVGSEPFYMVSASGKITKINPPKFWSHSSILFRADHRWLLVSRYVKKDATVSIDVSSDELGTSWERRQLTLWRPDRHASFTLTEIDGKPAFVIVPASGEHGFIATLATDGSHDLSVRRFEIPSVHLSHACATTAGELARASVEHPFQPLEIVDTTFGGALHFVKASLSIAPNGAACWDAVSAFGAGSSMLIPLRDLGAAVIFREQKTHAGSCALVP